MKIGVYPGTFDPITDGHLDIIKRANQLFDLLYIVVPINPQKNTLFTIEERLDMIRKAVSDYKNIIVESTNLLTVEYAKSVNAVAMIRGLRMVSDFEYELQMATINKCLNEDIETIFIMSSHEYSFLSSSSVKEIARFHGDVYKFVTNIVCEKLKEKFE